MFGHYCHIDYQTVVPWRLQRCRCGMRQKLNNLHVCVKDNKMATAAAGQLS